MQTDTDNDWCLCKIVDMESFPQTVSCDCGEVEYRAVSKPIVTAVCYCHDCQKAGDEFDAIPSVQPFREADGGTQYVTLHEKDWQPVRGQELLKPFKLKPKSATTRYMANCCNSPMFVKFEPGFWASVYRPRFKQPPPLEWRNKVSRRRSKLLFEDQIPRYQGFPLRLFWRLGLAWISGLFAGSRG